jgi:hypothetical protein
VSALRGRTAGNAAPASTIIWHFAHRCLKTNFSAVATRSRAQSCLCLMRRWRWRARLSCLRRFAGALSLSMRLVIMVSDARFVRGLLGFSS